MDYTKVPRSLIYRDRRSLEEFGAYEMDSITRPLADVMLRQQFIQQSESEDRALWCMNTAFYICTMILLEVDPRWRISEYKRIAIPNWKFQPEQFQILTLSLVGILLSRLEKPLHLLSFKGKARNHFVSLMLDGREINPIFNQLFDQLQIDPFINPTIPNSTFAPRVIDKETVHDVMSESNFNWVRFTNFLEERSIRDIVKAFGNTEEEKHNIGDMLRQASHGFYTAGYNDRPEQVDLMLDDIDQEIHMQYNPEDAIVDEGGEQERFLEFKPWEDARIDMLENENAKLHEEINQLKEYIKNAITIDTNNEVIHLREFGSIVDNAPKMHGDAIGNYSADSQQEKENDENLRQNLADAQKKIDEQAHTIEELQAEVEKMSSTLPINDEMDVDYDDVNKWAKVIFFATVLNAAYQKKFTVGQQLALFICLICGGKPSTYQPLISKIASMEDNEKDKSGESYSPQVIKAANEIVKRLVEIPEGKDVHPTIQRYIDSICDEFSIEKPKKKEH